MDVALVTVGDELLAGETVDGNASWLAAELSDRGVSVPRILTVPDTIEAIATGVRRYHARYDAVIVTGGIGGTHDDLTMAALATALDRDLSVQERVVEALETKLEAFRDTEPALLEEYDLDIDLEDAASLPMDARPIVVDAAWAPGCVLDGVYVFAGIPEEMQAMFATVADEFAGDRQARTVYTAEPEAALRARLQTAADRFDVAVGSYPGSPDRPGRIRISGTDEAAVTAATRWVRDAVQTVESPAARD